MARFLAPFDSLLLYELLPYHALGDAKLQSLGLESQQAFTTPTSERMRELADIARRHLSHVRPEAPDNGSSDGAAAPPSTSRQDP
jgi:hypothetical protein